MPPPRRSSRLAWGAGSLSFGSRGIRKKYQDPQGAEQAPGKSGLCGSRGVGHRVLDRAQVRSFVEVPYADALWVFTKN